MKLSTSIFKFIRQTEPVVPSNKVPLDEALDRNVGDRSRPLILPILISATFLMETIDSTLLVTALPKIASDLQVDPVEAKLALSTYFLVMAALIPLSGWLTERVGPRIMFCAAIGAFTIGSVLCAYSPSLSILVFARTLQGVGGAMMFPVGRVILVKSVSKKDLVAASSYLTIPGAVAPIFSPLLAGYVATYSDWRWLFWINVPLGCLGMALAGLFVPNDIGIERRPFDVIGFCLSGLGLAALGFGLTSLGGQVVPVEISVFVSFAGAVFACLYIFHARKSDNPLLDLSLLKHRTFKIAITGSFVTRAAVFGALPFLVPMMLQVGFGLTPLESASLTFTGAIGSLFTKFIITRALRRAGFRNLLILTAVLTTFTIMALAFVGRYTPHALIMAVIFCSSLFRLLQILALEAMVFAEIPQRDLGAASGLLSVVKQLAASAGIAYSAFLLRAFQSLRGDIMLQVEDFHTALIFVAIPIGLTAIMSAKLSPNDGFEISGRVTRAR
ncbi:drug resistance transporter, EmrB/QacA subfamily [Rhizobium miluonense]|uniref:Drug resistance transporter, EmrB/QacA subfamily n=2 Tax=Rhizobium miluonense TaxID=411945 RepID=A0A1C3XBJ3_9HYPH|nr:drug resistance transporter, EmrB/QacA subfamily [Rhizobium miluonense]